ncbi:MAG TPA: LacI family DNA-binding transcriptional regulator [Acidimicrobiales bacterium]|nr:LacI family DNA-binding transcriptional regulator [Acidimicrobiales bacterium]
MPDVARAAGVSLKTVSRVINGEQGVSAGTMARVNEAIAALGFRRNDIARGLRSGQTSASIGLVIGDIANPFYSAIARAVETVAGPRHFMVVIGSSDESPEREQELVASLFQRRVDGLLVVPAPGSHRYLEAEIAMGTPIVFLDRPPVGIKADTVVIENRKGAEQGVAHLIAEGHRRIAMVGDRPAIYTARERLAGYRRALEAAGLPVDEGLMRLGPHDPEAAEAATYELLDLPDPPTAFFTSNNRMTVGVVHALWSRGVEAGLVGFDDFELADMLPVPFTVITHQPSDMAGRAAELLFDRIDGNRGGPPRRIALPTELVPRGRGLTAAVGAGSR